MEYLIFFGSIMLMFVFSFFQPVLGWFRAVRMKPGASVLFFLAFTSTFLGGVREVADSDADMPGGLRVLRLIVMVAIFLIAFKGVLGRLSVFRLSGKAAHFMLLFSLVAIMSAQYSVDATVTLWKGFEVLSIVLLGIYLACELKTLEDVQWLVDALKLILLFLVITALIGLAVSPGTALAKLELSSSIVLRGIAPPINSNSLTQFGALLAVMYAAAVLQMKSGRRPWLFWVIFGLSAAVMLLGHSRTSILAGVLAMGGVLFFGRHRILAIIMGATGGLALLLGEVLENYFYRGQSADVFMSMSGRTYFWESVWGYVVEAPIFGHGYYAATRVLFSTSSVDNTYLEVVLGLGFVGLLVFVWPVVINAFGLLRTIPKKTDSLLFTSMWLQLMALFVMLFVRSLTGPSFHVLHPNLVMFMLLCIGVSALHRLRYEKQR